MVWTDLPRPSPPPAELGDLACLESSSDGQMALTFRRKESGKQAVSTQDSSSAGTRKKRGCPFAPPRVGLPVGFSGPAAHPLTPSGG